MVLVYKHFSGQGLVISMGAGPGVLDECSSTGTPPAALARVSSTRFVSRRPMGAFVKYEMDLRVCGLVSFKTENLRKTAQLIFVAYNSTY